MVESATAAPSPSASTTLPVNIELLRSVHYFLRNTGPLKWSRECLLRVRYSVIFIHTGVVNTHYALDQIGSYVTSM